MDVNAALQELIARRHAQPGSGAPAPSPAAPPMPSVPPTAAAPSAPSMPPPPVASAAPVGVPSSLPPRLRAQTLSSQSLPSGPASGGPPAPAPPAPARPPMPALAEAPSGDGAHDTTFVFSASGVEEGVPAFVHDIIERVPTYYSGTDRLIAFTDHLDRLGQTERTQLRDVFESFVTRMIDLNASDLDAGGPAANGYIWYRTGGDKKPRPELGTFSMDETNVLFLSALNDKQRGVLWAENSVDFSYELDFLGTDGRARRFRATCYYDYDHLALNMRSITDEVRPLKGLEFHPLIERGLMFRHERDGLTLITGVTGSGKSSTLDAIIDANNEDVHAHIVIVGKPIEYMHRSKKCIIRHREVGKDVPKFKDGIVQALRQDPDIVVIGEMRDPETISSGLEITDSGHKVFSTLHTSSAVESIDRIIGEYSPEEQERIRNRLADVLRCIVSQKLAPRLGGGRVLCKEVLWMTSAARAAIKNKNAGEIYQMMWEGGALGMITMEQDLARLVRQRLVSPETAYSYANNKKRLQQLLG